MTNVGRQLSSRPSTLAIPVVDYLIFSSSAVSPPPPPPTPVYHSIRQYALLVASGLNMLGNGRNLVKKTEYLEPQSASRRTVTLLSL